MKSTTAQMAVSATSHSSAATETAAPAATMGSGGWCAASAVTSGTRNTHSAGWMATSAPTGTLPRMRGVRTPERMRMTVAGSLAFWHPGTDWQGTHLGPMARVMYLGSAAVTYCSTMRTKEAKRSSSA